MLCSIPPTSFVQNVVARQSKSRWTMQVSERTGCVPYFAYFSNLSPNVLGPRSRIPLRRINIIKSKQATLHKHCLLFNVPAPIPGSAYANLSTSDDEDVKGVIFWISSTDFDRLTLSEGITKVWKLPYSGDVQRINVTTDDGTTINAKTFVWDVPFPAMRPLRRYRSLAIEGACFHGMDREYLTFLRSIPCISLPFL